jgi:hypothetical protein
VRAALVKGLARRARRAIRAGGGHRAERIAARDDARLEQDVLAREPVRIATAVPALVGGADDPTDVAHQPADAVEHPLPGDGVRAHDRPLIVVERAGLVDDLVRDGNLADIV